jgi:hypothetical protein
MTKYIQFPISDEEKYDAIMGELSMSEIQSAIASKYNESVETGDDGKSEDELAQYDSVTDIMEDSSLSEVRQKQLKLKAERRRDISNR